MIDRRHLIGMGLAAFVPLSAAAGEPVIVPLHFDEDGRPYVSASFNGHGPYNLLLSTGTALNTGVYMKANANFNPVSGPMPAG